MSYVYFDSREGLLAALESLETLNNLAHERYMAGYAHEENLSPWAIGGRWLLDSCGNFASLGIHNHSQRQVAELNLPPVLSYEQLDEELKAKEVKDFTFAHMHFSLPPAGSRCPRTGTRWTIDNAHLAVRMEISDFEWEVDERWEGMTWDEISRPELLADGTTVCIAPTTIFIRGIDGVIRVDHHVPYTHTVKKGEGLQFSKVCYVHMDSCS